MPSTLADRDHKAKFLLVIYGSATIFTDRLPTFDTGLRQAPLPQTRPEHHLTFRAARRYLTPLDAPRTPGPPTYLNARPLKGAA